MIFHTAERLAEELERDVPEIHILMIANGVGLLRDIGITDIPLWAANCPDACWLVRARPPDSEPFWAWYENHCDDLLVDFLARYTKLEPESTYLDERMPSYRYYIKGGDAS